MPQQVPPADSPAKEAFLSQGSNLLGEKLNAYIGVDRWIHPRADIPTLTVFAQFDHREPAKINAENTLSSNFFTDEATVKRFTLANGQLDSRGISEALQLMPYRADEASVKDAHKHGARMVLYVAVRPLKARSVQRTQLAEFGHGRTRNNIHLGSGSAPQYYIEGAKKYSLSDKNCPFQRIGIIESDRTTLGHGLHWLKDLERQRKTNDQIGAAIPDTFSKMVKLLLQSSLPQLQTRGAEIKELVETNLKTKLAERNNILLANGVKLPHSNPAIKPAPAPIPKRRRGPHI